MAMIPPVILHAMTVVTLLVAGSDPGTKVVAAGDPKSDIVISSDVLLACVVAAVVNGGAVETSGQDSAFSSVKYDIIMHN